MVMCGNPTKITGFFYDSHPPSARELYNAMHIDGRDSSRVDQQQFIDTIIDMFGEASGRSSGPVLPGPPTPA